MKSARIIAAAVCMFLTLILAAACSSGMGYHPGRISGCTDEDNTCIVSTAVDCRPAYIEYAEANGDAPAGRHATAQPEACSHARSERSV